MRAPILFIYHGNCFDGFTAAWVFEHFRKKGLSLIDRPVEYYPAVYGKEPPDCKGKEVWLVDFSYKRNVMIEKIIKPSTRTVVLDHHKTAEADLNGILDEVRMMQLQRQNDKVIFDMSRSGAGILYDELAKEFGKRAGQHIPTPNGSRGLWLVDYIEDRDLWKWKLPDSETIAAYVSSMPMDFNTWDAINAMRRMDVVEGGRAIQRYIDTFGRKAREQGRMEEIAGHRVPTINTPYMNCSDHVGKLCEENPEASFAAGYFRRADGRWQFSLRSRGDFDVSSIAMLFNGGGHKNAAGFDVACLPWDKNFDGTVSPAPSAPAVTDPEDKEIDILHMGEDSV